MSKPVRVLCVDDSAFVRKVLTDELGRHAGIEVVACANDPIEARDVLLSKQIDVMLLDVEMPHMDGITFLEQLMAKRPMPVVMFSTVTQAGGDLAMRALSLGAVDVVRKPTSIAGMRSLGSELAAKLTAASLATLQPSKGLAGNADRSGKPENVRLYRRPLLLLGASTGGTEALREVFSELPRDTPGTLVVQHMPPQFTAAFAGSLDKASAMTVREAKDGDRLFPGLALVAPGGHHMVVEGRNSTNLTVRIIDGAPVCHQKPAVDVLFKSAAQKLGPMAVAAVLTGMGRDGAEGLLAFKQAGCRTVAQNEATSVVYGMPKAAYENGSVDQVLALRDVAPKVLEMLTQK